MSYDYVVFLRMGGFATFVGYGFSQSQLLRELTFGVTSVTQTFPHAVTICKVADHDLLIKFPRRKVQPNMP